MTQGFFVKKPKYIPSVIIMLELKAVMAFVFGGFEFIFISTAHELNAFQDMRQPAVQG